MAQEQQIAQIKPQKKLLARMGDRFGVDPEKMMDTLKNTAFRQQGNAAITDEQMMALLVVADQHKLNPWTKEIYAFPDKQNGIVPIVGVDGWSRILNDHPEYDGIEFVESPEHVKMDEDAQSCPEWIECVIYRKDRKHPTRIREHLDECYRPAFKKDGYTKKGPWQTHTKRMLRHKSKIQCAREAFSFSGIYDQDEAERIREGDWIDAVVINDTDANAAPVEPQSATDDLKAQLGDKLKPASEVEPPADTGPIDDDWVAEYDGEPDPAA